MKPDLHQVRLQAQNELRNELHREAVDAEKARLRAEGNQSLWQRLINKLPFTLQLRRKAK